MSGMGETTIQTTHVKFHVQADTVDYWCIRDRLLLKFW